MTDRELIEAAAKAAGVYLAPEWRGHHKHLPDWNPLEDDGDALRLAVALRLTVSIEGDEESEERSRTQAVHPRIGSVCVNHRADPAAATRRAITRAAAALAGTAPAEGGAS